MSKPLRLIVCGAAGRMGSQVVSLAGADARVALIAQIGRRTSAENFRSALSYADMIVDFSAPEASVRFAAAAAAARKPIVIGTTGLSAKQSAFLAKSARSTPIFYAPNFSFGIAVLRRLAAQASRVLGAFDVGISEIHHSAKRDAPSGTALALASEVAAARPRPKTPIASQRLGDVVGEHTVTFAGPFERLEMTHRAHSRALFARGALEAALWLRGRKPGLYRMSDMVAL